jgi:hypothetical protein
MQGELHWVLGMNYKAYYVKVAWEWFLAMGSSCFSSIGKVQGFFYLFYVRWGWENKTGKKSFAQEGKKQVLIGWGKTTMRWGALEGGMQITQR